MLGTRRRSWRCSLALACGGRTGRSRDKHSAAVDAKGLLKKARDGATPRSDVDGADRDVSRGVLARAKTSTSSRSASTSCIHAGRAPARRRGSRRATTTRSATSQWRLPGRVPESSTPRRCSPPARARTRSTPREQLVAVNADDAGRRTRRRAARWSCSTRTTTGSTSCAGRVHLEPNAAMYHISLGTALDKLGKLDEAALEFRAGRSSCRPTTSTRTSYARHRAARAGRVRRGEARTSTRRSSSTRAAGARTSSSACLDNAAEQARRRRAGVREGGRSSRRTSRCSGTRTARSSGSRIATTKRSPRTRRRVELDPPYPEGAAEARRPARERKQYDDAERELTAGGRRDFPKDPLELLSLGDVYAAKQAPQGRDSTTTSNTYRLRPDDPDRRARPAGHVPVTPLIPP